MPHNLNILHDTLATRLVLDLDPEVSSATDVQAHNLKLESDSCEYKFDIAQIWCSPTRWTTLVRQYIDPEAYADWLEGIRTMGMKRGLAFMRTNSVESRGAGRRRWGACILGFGYKSRPEPTLTMHSRTTFLGYIGALDLALAHVIARDIAHTLGLPGPGAIRFVWFVEAAQFHSMRSLPWFFQDKGRTKILFKGPELKDDKRSGLAIAHKQLRTIRKMDKEGVLYADMSYAIQNRFRRRLHTEHYGVEYGEQFEGGTRLSGNSGTVLRPCKSYPIKKFILPTNRKKVQDGEAGLLDEDLMLVED